MKVIPEGTLKYLLLDPEQIERNVRRQNRLGAPAVVAEVTPDVRGGVTYHNGHGVLVEGTAALVYEKSGKGLVKLPQLLGRRRVVRASYATTAKVAIAETPEEAASLGLPAPAPKATKAKPKNTKPATEENKQ